LKEQPRTEPSGGPLLAAYAPGGAMGDDDDDDEADIDHY